MDRKTKKWLQKRADYANSIIHRENLYLAGIIGQNNRRVYDCHIDEHNTLVVRDLYRDGSTHPVDGNRFFNGYGTEVFL